MFALDATALPITSPDGDQLWCPGPSLWNLITEHVYESDLPRIHSALGHSLVDMYTEVHTEAERWHKMWQESQEGCQRGPPLPDPPAVKELVRAEVKMLLQTLRERASKGGRDCQELLVQYNMETVNYALGHLESCYDNCPNPGDNGTGSRPSSNCSVQSKADEIEAVKDKLNVIDIDQVVDRLKSVLMEECKELKGLVQHLRENVKQNYSVFDKSEPSLGELRELREAVQMDLELYPSAFGASPTALSPLPVKELRNRFRLSARLRASDETLQALTTASALRPHPPPPLCHTNPRPPAGPPHTKTSASVKPNHTFSPSMTQSQHRSTSAVSNSRLKTPMCIKIATSEHANSVTTDQIMVKSEYHYNLSPDQGSAGLHHRNLTPSPSFQIRTQRKSPVHEAHLSSHHSTQDHSKCGLSPETERKGSHWRSKAINITHVQALRSLCDAGSCSSNNADHSVSTKGKSATQNGQQKSTCEASLMPSTVQPDNNRIKSISEALYPSVLSETGSSSSQNSSRRNSSGIDADKNGQLVNQQQSLRSHCLTLCSSHHSDSSSEQRQNKSGQPATIQMNGQFFTSPKTPLKGATSHQKSAQEAQTELEIVNKFYQPVPPEKVST